MTLEVLPKKESDRNARKARIFSGRFWVSQWIYKVEEAENGLLCVFAFCRSLLFAFSSPVWFCSEKLYLQHQGISCRRCFRGLANWLGVW